jgi:hypothetical protein
VGSKTTGDYKNKKSAIITNENCGISFIYVPQRDSNSCSRLEKIVVSEILLISKQNKANLPKKIPQVLEEVLAVTFHKIPTR